MTTINEEVEKLRREAEASVSEAERLVRLHEKYPDMKKYVGRWNRIAYYSRSVNEIVDEVELRHNCGCCNDSPLEAWPFLQTENGRVYSDPPRIVVGEKHWIAGDRPEDGWEEKLLKEKIPEKIIEVIRSRFKTDHDMRVSIAESS